MHSSTDLFHKIRVKWFPSVEIGHFDIHLLVPPIEVLLSAFNRTTKMTWNQVTNKLHIQLKLLPCDQIKPSTTKVHKVEEILFYDNVKTSEITQIHCSIIL